MKPLCKLAHPFILAGACPWCNSGIYAGQVVEHFDAGAIDLEWNVPVILEAVRVGPRLQAQIALWAMGRHDIAIEISSLVLCAGLHRVESDLQINAGRTLLRLGRSLSNAQAEDFDRRIESSAEDYSFALRILLLGFYLGREDLETCRTKIRDNILWIINNMAGNRVVSCPECILSPDADQDDYQAVSKAWMSQIEHNANNVDVLANGAAFFSRTDPAYSRSLYKRASELEPDNARWNIMIGDLYTMDACYQEGEGRVNQTREALSAYRKAKTKKLSRASRSHLLVKTARASLDIFDIAYARTCAIEIIHESHLQSAKAMCHEAHLLLGRCSILDGDTNQAKTDLANAAEYPCPDGFGPNLMLAKELLDRDERDVVIKYLRACAVYWHAGKESINDWIRLIAAGINPDFGPNLRY